MRKLNWSGLLVLWALSLWGCQDQSAPDASEPERGASAAAELSPAGKEMAAEPRESGKGEEEKKPVVVYSGRGEVLVGSLFEKFTAMTGIPVEVRYDKSSEGLANRIATEGKETPMDVFFAQDSGFLGALGEKEFLRTLPESLTGQTEKQYLDPNGRWLPTSGRARVLVYSPDRVKPEELPRTLEELADPRFKDRLGWAPGNGSFQAHVSALRSLWGEEKTHEWLKRLLGNNPKAYRKNGPQVRAVSKGEIDLGWVNHYYLHKIKATSPDLKAVNYSFPEKGDAGNLMMLSGAGISSFSDNVKNAEALLEFLVSESAQNHFAGELFEYPTRPGVRTHPDVPPLTEATVRVNQAALTDIGPTLTLLRELGVQ